MPLPPSTTHPAARRRVALATVAALLIAAGCSEDADPTAPEPPAEPAPTHAPPPPESDGPVDTQASGARAADGQTIWWREHLIDAPDVNGGIEIRGADGLALADLDGDGRADVVSVHEDSGHVRVAFAGGAPDDWTLTTLADAEVDGAEDVSVGDLDADGDLDLAIACERGHVAVFENPGATARNGSAWGRITIEATRGRGAYIRVGIADMDADGHLDLTVANKSLQQDLAGKESTPSAETIGAVLRAEPTPISVLHHDGRPFDAGGWREVVLGTAKVPMHAAPVDLDGDGDLDVVGGGRGKLDGLIFFVADDETFEARTIAMTGLEPVREAGLPLVNGQTLVFHDINGDGRLDIVTPLTLTLFGWLEQPADPTAAWPVHVMGDLAPDHPIGLAMADIDGDGREDILVGGYSKGERQSDGDATVDDPLGRLAWFAAPEDPTSRWRGHDISRRVRGMFDALVPVDLDADGDLDFIGTRGNSGTYDGVFWLEQRRTDAPVRRFLPARETESRAMPLP